MSPKVSKFQVLLLVRMQCQNESESKRVRERGLIIPNLVRRGTEMPLESQDLSVSFD